MKEQQETTKLEFLMTVNDNIIVQRFFNVRDYNPKAKKSVDLYEYLKDFKERLCNEFKMKSVVYLLDNQYEIASNPSVLDTSFTNGPEHFNIFIKENDVTVCHRRFDAKVFPPKIRYTVDIRPHIKNLLYDLTDIFSSKNLTFEFAEVNTNA
jgi:hypothetical protein